MRAPNYLVKRMIFAVITVFVAITINFFLFRVLPGTAVTDLSRVPHASPQLRHALEVEFGLNKPKWEQYLIYLKQLAHLNLGVSFTYQEPVTTLLRQDLANTIPMVAAGTLLAIVVGIVTGVLSAWRRGSVADHISTTTAIVFYALPTQWLGMILLILLANYLPSSGMTNAFAFTTPTLWARIQQESLHMILPATTLFLTLYGEYTLIVRSSMLETLGEDYVLTARAKGLPDRTVIRRHALRNALLPTVTLIALSLGYIVAGAILVEIVFTWPGIGWGLYQAVEQRDYPMLQGGFLVLTLSVVFFNFVADILYFRLDPRITT